MFDWHLCEQNRKTVPSLRMNILPVPGSISLPQKEQDRRVGIVSPDRELARFPRRLAEHEDVADLDAPLRSEEHTSELQSHSDLVCRLLLEKKKKKKKEE